MILQLKVHNAAQLWDKQEAWTRELKKDQSWHNCSYRRFNCFRSWFYQTAWLFWRLFWSDVIAQTCYTVGTRWPRQQQHLRSVQGNKRSFCSQREDGSDQMERFSNVNTPYQEIRWHRQLWLITYQQARGKQQIPQIQLWPTLSRCFVSLLGKNTDFIRAIFQLWTRVKDVASIYEWKILDKANTCFCGLALWLDNLSELECVGQAVFQERDNVCCLSWHLVGQYTCFGCDWGIWYFTKQDFNRGWYESEKGNWRYIFKALLCVIEDSN